MNRLVGSVATVIAFAALSGCGGDGSDAQTLHVSAAASLTDAFTELAEAFEDEHPDIDVVLDFAASSTLARQVADGAPTDVLATADEETMGQVVDGGHAADPHVFARNRLAIVVASGNPKGVTGLDDLAESGLVVVLCAPEVPCGRYAAAALAAADVTVEAASLEENVKAVVSRVALGEADAGIAYVTDVQATDGGVDGLEIAVDGGADEQALEVRYPLAVTHEGRDERVAADAWVAFVLSDKGQTVLGRFGFLPV